MLGPVALLLVVEAVRVSAVLPGGHQIKTVTQSRWHRIALQVSGWLVLTQVMLDCRGVLAVSEEGQQQLEQQ